VLTLADVLEALTGIRSSKGNQVITEASIDSRQVIPGALFIALPGERTDGHDYVEQAFDNGASFAFVQRKISDQLPILDVRDGLDESIQNTLESPYCILVDDCLQALQRVASFWRRKLDVKVIGITGSVGKSTTKELTSDVLCQRYSTLKSRGNLNNEIGLPLTILGLSEGHERAVLEMGFYVPGEIKLLCEISLPWIGVITNIGTVHAERAGTIDEIAKGKAELVESLPREGVAILNYDDPRVKAMAEQTQARVFFYGLNPEAHLWADGVEGLGLEGIHFRLHYRNEVIHLRVPLIGRHSVHTALRASAVGLAEGLTWEEIVYGLRQATTQLRLIAVRTESGALLLDDTYNASPESTLAALNLLDELDGRKVAVLGDMLELGRYEWRGHEMVGIRAAEVIDELITIGERGRMIAAAANRAGLAGEMITEFDDANQAIRFLEGNLEKDDVVLIKGSRGMQMDRIVAALEYRQ
jgi:UDP-N-acetylmuramoyl-tripeptide--D-alanyl-D-alanine ligase